MKVEVDLDEIQDSIEEIDAISTWWRGWGNKGREIRYLCKKIQKVLDKALEDKVEFKHGER